MSSCSPSSRRPGIRPRTSSSAPRSSTPPASRSRRSRPRRTGSSRSWARRGSTSTSRTPAPCARTAACKPCTGSTTCRTTASSTSTGTSPPDAISSFCGSANASVGPTICEDIWQPGPPATDLALAGAQLVVNLSASPFHVGKAEEREEMLVTRARDTSSYLAFCNLVGGQDELVFDGHSVVLDDSGEVVARAPGFEEHLLVVDVEPADAMGRRLRDVRRRELDRTRDSVPEVEVVELERPLRRRVARSRPRSLRSSPSSSRCAVRSPSASATTSRRTGSRRS